MPTISEIRAQYPQYQDMSDQALADAMHAKFYSDMPREDFNKRVGFEADKPNMAVDVAKSAAVGVGKGMIGLATMVPDISNVMHNLANHYVIDPILEKTIGLPKGPVADTPNINKMFGHENAQKKIESVTGDFYQPKTLAGEYAGKVGEFVPGGMIGGGASLPVRFMTNVVAPAVVSETAGQVTKDTPYEPFARFGGAIAGGIGASKLQSALTAPSRASAMSPSADDLIRTAGQQFEKVRTSGATVDPHDAQIVAQGIKSSLDGRGFNSVDHAPVFRALDRMEAFGAAGKPVSMNDMEAVRKALSTAKLSSDGATRTAARQATDEFMQWLPQITPQGVRETLGKAISNYSAGKRSNTVMGKSNLGELNADTAGSGANTDNALRQAIKQLVRPVNNDIVPKAKTLGFNDAEIAQMNAVARGTTAGNVARFIGKAAPTGIVSGGLSAGAGYSTLGPVGAVALPAVGYVSKMLGDMSTRRGISALDQMVRSRSALANSIAAQSQQATPSLSPQSMGLLSGLIAAINARQGVKEPAGKNR